MSCIDLNCQDMVKGQAYTFYFKYSGFFQFNVASDAVVKSLAGDSNFKNVSAVEAHCGLLCAKKSVFAVSFIYVGQGSNVGQAGQEMQNVINNSLWCLIGTTLVYDGAVQGVASPCCDPGCAGSGISWTFVALVLLGFAGLAYYMGWHNVILQKARSLGNAA